MKNSLIERGLKNEVITKRFRLRDRQLVNGQVRWATVAKRMRRIDGSGGSGGETIFKTTPATWVTSIYKTLW